MDAIPVSHIDVTGWHTVTELIDELQDPHVRFVIAGRRTQVRTYAESAGITPGDLEGRLFPTIGMAVRRYLEENPAAQTAPSANPADATS